LKVDEWESILMFFSKKMWNIRELNDENKYRAVRAKIGELVHSILLTRNQHAKHQLFFDEEDCA
jgi:hypothetical protein